MDKKIKAIVTRAVPYRESDMVLTLVSPEEGRLTASARGCLKPRAKLRYAAEPMNFGEYMLAGKGDRYIVTDCVQYDSFSPVTSDIDRYYAACMILELLSNALRGAGDALVPMVISVGGICGLRILWVLFVVPHWHTLLSISICYPISWLLTATILIIYYKKGRWMRHAPVSPPVSGS